MSNETQEEIIDDGQVHQEDNDSKELDFLTKPVEEMTTDDAEALRKFALTQKAQKEHFRKKANEPKEEKKPEAEEIKKNNTEQPDLTQEIDIRFLKRDGLSEDDIEQLKFIQAGLKAQGKNVTLMEAQSHELYKSYETNKSLSERKVKAQLISAGGGNFHGGKEMTEEEWESNRKNKADEILSRM